MANTASTGTPTDAPQAKVFPPLDVGTFAPQLLWLALTFALLYVILKRAVLPRVGEVIEERSDRVKRDLAQAEALKVETQKALSSYEGALSDAQAEARIGETKSRALASVGDIASEVAGTIVTRLIGAEPTKDEVKRALVQRAAE